MLRVGLTGGLGSGKSTVAAWLRELGAQVIEADELGRALMEPGQPVFTEIVRVFGSEVVGADGRLNRARLAELAFKGGRLDDLNAIVHPAVIAAQRAWMEQVFKRDPAAVAVVESALIFEVERDARACGEKETVLADWRRRIDRVVVVTAPDEVKIARYAARVSPALVSPALVSPALVSPALVSPALVSPALVSPEGQARASAAADARVRLAHQIPDAEKAARADYVLENTGDIESLHAQVRELWMRLKAESNKFLEDESLK